MLVVRDMVFHGKQSFSQLREMPEGISSNILAERLVRLESAGILVKIADPDDGRRFSYELTKHGRGLIPVLLDLMVWSRKHTRDVDVSRKIIKLIEEDRDAAAAEIERRLDASTS